MWQRNLIVSKILHLVSSLCSDPSEYAKSQNAIVHEPYNLGARSCLSDSNFEDGDKCRVSCKNGYELYRDGKVENFAVIKCSDNNWAPQNSKNNFECIPVCSAPVATDFDENSYLEDVNDNAQWVKSKTM